MENKIHMLYTLIPCT